MSDAILHEKELRLEDAIRKLAWFEEEYRELQLLPVVKDYLYLSGKFEWELTPEERSRLKTVENTTEAKQFRRNEGNRILSGRDEIAAREDLVEYKTSNKISLVPLQFNMRGEFTVYSNFGCFLQTFNAFFKLILLFWLCRLLSPKCYLHDGGQQCVEQCRGS